MYYIYAFVAFYSFFSIDTTFALSNELEKSKEHTSFIMSFFSTDLLLNVIFAGIVIILTFLTSKIVSARLTSALERSATGEGGNKEELIGVLSRTANITILTIGFSITLGILGVDMAIFLGGLGFGIGFTLKIFLSNFIAGIIMVTQGSYHNGDIIEIEEKVGQIKRINALFTEVEQYDGVIFYIPNVKFLEENVANFHSNNKRRVEIDVGVDYATDIVKAKNIIMQILEQFPNILKAPAADIFVLKLGESGVNLSVRFWVDSKTGNYFEMKSNVTETINLAFKKAGIVIPYPHITVVNKK